MCIEDMLKASIPQDYVITLREDSSHQNDVIQQYSGDGISVGRNVNIEVQATHDQTLIYSVSHHPTQNYMNND